MATNITNIIAVPSLSVRGWVTALSEKADLVVAHFFASDDTQSHLYDGNISNFQVLAQKYAGNLPALEKALRTGLEQYMNRYYDNVSVDVTDDTKTNLSNRNTLILYITVEEQGVTYVLANLLALVDGKFNSISRYNETGVVS